MIEPDWFRALLETSADVYFRYSLIPPRRFVYLSPSVEALSGHPPKAFYDDAELCLSLLAREDRRLLHQVLRARRGLSLTLHLTRNGVSIPLALRTVTVIRSQKVVAIEGVIATHFGHGQQLTAPAQASDPSQMRLAALMYEVHDLLHRVLPERASQSATADTLGPHLQHLGALTFDHERLAVAEGGVPVSLTSRELLVLRYLLQRPGRIVTRAQLLTDVWGYRYTGDDRTVDVHISRLRRKLPSLSTSLVAVKGIGYRLDTVANCSSSRNLPAISRS
jgi:DNA-binding winged helix-turn-helix (wHTH) protein